MIDLLTIARFGAALAFVLLLIGGVAWLMRRYLNTGAIGSAARRRLGVVESTMLDGKSRLVLVRRDDKEHLLVIGPASTTVVEAGIPARPAEAPPTALRAITNGER
jgi:flagellar protein FliO/FliZ